MACGERAQAHAGAPVGHQWVGIAAVAREPGQRLGEQGEALVEPVPAAQRRGAGDEGAVVVALVEARPPRRRNPLAGQRAWRRQLKKPFTVSRAVAGAVVSRSGRPMSPEWKKPASYRIIRFHAGGTRATQSK